MGIFNFTNFHECDYAFRSKQFRKKFLLDSLTLAAEDTRNPPKRRIPCIKQFIITLQKTTFLLKFQIHVNVLPTVSCFKQLSHSSQPNSCHAHHNQTAVTLITTKQLSNSSQPNSCHTHHNQTAVTLITTKQLSNLSQPNSCNTHHNQTAVMLITTKQL
jgi:hypothetical protein